VGFLLVLFLILGLAWPGFLRTKTKDGSSGGGLSGDEQKRKENLKTLHAFAPADSNILVGVDLKTIKNAPAVKGQWDFIVDAALRGADLPGNIPPDFIQILKDTDTLLVAGKASLAGKLAAPGRIRETFVFGLVTAGEHEPATV